MKRILWNQAIDDSLSKYNEVETDKEREAALLQAIRELLAQVAEQNLTINELVMREATRP